MDLIFTSVMCVCVFGFFTDVYQSDMIIYL